MNKKFRKNHGLQMRVSRLSTSHVSACTIRTTLQGPNALVNIVIGVLIIKEPFDLFDDEIVKDLMLDFHYQYALQTTSYVEQPLSDKNLSRFRKRFMGYETAYIVDLYHDCIKNICKNR
jgi:hypothetical protein